MPKYEFAGTAEFGVFTGSIEIPDTLDPVDFTRSPEGKKAIYDAFEEW